MRWRQLGLLLLEISFLAANAAAQTGVAPCGWRGSHQWLSARASPLDSTLLMLGATTAKICYSRPSVRGRSIDSLLPLRRAWRTGANEPTTLTITGALSVGGAVLKVGRYVIVSVPDVDQWTVVFHTTDETEPGRIFASLKQVTVGHGRVEVPTRTVEQFTISAHTSGDSSAFVLEWGNRRVRVPVDAIPSRQ